MTPPTAPRDDAALVPEATARERERAAWFQGVNAAHDAARDCRRAPNALYRWDDLRGVPILRYDEAKAYAAAVYPAPSRPRIARDPHSDVLFKIGSAAGVDGPAILCRRVTDGDEAQWSPAGRWTAMQPTPERVALWAELLANPTEPSDAPVADAAGRAG